MHSNRLFGDERAQVESLVNALTPNSRVTSHDALILIDKISAAQLQMPWSINTKMAFTSCKLEKSVQPTAGTQCLINLFDPGNGWVRNCFKRGDMLIMASKLVEKGADLEGMSYYEKTLTEETQSLITDRDGDPSATLNNEIVERFIGAGYEFSYPDNVPTRSPER